MSTLELENIKHPDNSGNNIELNSDGSISNINVSETAKVGTDIGTSAVKSQKLLISGTKTSYANNSFSLWQNQLAIHDDRVPSGGAGTEAGVGGSISFTANAGGGQKTWLGLVEGYKQNSTAGDYGGGLKMRVRQHNNPTMLTGIHINSNGYVTTPKQPNVRLSLANHFGNNNTSPNYPGDQIGNFHVYENIGNHWNSSNNNFTCPVTGVYCISVFYIKYPASGAAHVDLHKNGTAFQNIRWRAPEGTSSYEQVGGTVFVSCAANDILDWHYFGNPGIHSGNGQWSIRLVG